MRKLLGGVAAACLAAAGSAGAATFSYDTDFAGGVGPEWTVSAGFNNGAPGILGQLSSVGAASATLSQTSVGASTSPLNGTLTFDLLGFLTIDGVNCCTDTFNLIINGSTRYQASFALGGSGAEQVHFNPDGATYTSSGSIRSISIPFTAVAGLNTFQFLYPALQGSGDEAFGLDNVEFSAEVTPPITPGPGIPEPATWAMMILGFGGVGTILRGRRRGLALA